jgi:hypothetical protein
MTESQTFEDNYSEVEALADRRSMDLAYDAARRLVEEFPDEIHAWFILNYVVCVGDKAGGPHFRSPDVVREAQLRFADRTTAEVTLTIGDMKRDRAIGLIRYAVDEFDLAAAEEIIAKLRGVYGGLLEKGEIIGEHRNDLNRLAELLDVEGRLHYARRQYIDADRKHSQAYTAWLALGRKADPVWVYNCRVHWLKAVVAAYGRRFVRAKWLDGSIHAGCPGSRNRGIEATVIRLPFVGNRLHDRLIRRR